MASISIPCPKSCSIGRQSSRNRNLNGRIVSFSRLNPSFLYGSAKAARFQGSKQSRFPILKAQVREASTEGSSNSTPMSSSTLETPSSDGKGPNVVDSAAHKSALSESNVSAFMAEVSDIVKLVDSRDIMELKLKQDDCELIIRKKAAFAQALPTAPIVMTQPQQQMFLPQPPVSQSTPPATIPAAPTSAVPSSSKSKSSLPPLKCPMAGTFYRCPAPGEPSFVKVGDKVQRGQVVCIIEAMKLMNEIEADQSGTVVEVVAEDGKPVSVDTPLLVIQP